MYTLVVENGGGAAVLTLSWERWDAEVLVLKEAGRNLRFEGGWVCYMTGVHVRALLRRSPTFYEGARGGGLVGACYLALSRFGVWVAVIGNRSYWPPNQKIVFGVSSF